MGKLLRRVLVGTLFLSACASGNDAPSDETSQSSTADELGRGNGNGNAYGRLEHHMPPGSASSASLKTLPNATCEVYPAERPADVGDRLRVFSDDDGVVRFHLNHLDPSVRAGDLKVDCTDDSGATSSQTLSVVIDEAAKPQTPEAYHKTGKPTLAKLDVPAASLSDEDVHARHYPPRPDAAKDPAGFELWSQVVQSGATVVSPHVFADKDRKHSAYSTSGNWSGYVDLSPATQPIYAWIKGDWWVPKVYSESGFWTSDYTSTWVGIDGWGSSDVVQDGTDQNTHTYFWISCTSYDAWTEWYPLYSQTVSNFSVNPGDHVYVWTWVLDSSGHYSSHPTVGWFYIWNQTQNIYTELSTGLPAGASFDGHSAEWVMERPGINGSISSLAQYAPMYMYGAQVVDLWGGSHNIAGDATDTSYNVTMTGNGGGKLSGVQYINPSTMYFTWSGHN
jgi:hypothetical protein